VTGSFKPLVKLPEVLKKTLIRGKPRKTTPPQKKKQTKQNKKKQTNKNIEILKVAMIESGKKQRKRHIFFLISWYRRIKGSP
jgi:hypothetical protein